MQLLRRWELSCHCSMDCLFSEFKYTIRIRRKSTACALQPAQRFPIAPAEYPHLKFSRKVEQRAVSLDQSSLCPRHCFEVCCLGAVCLFEKPSVFPMAASVGELSHRDGCGMSSTRRLVRRGGASKDCAGGATRRSTGRDSAGRGCTRRCSTVERTASEGSSSRSRLQLG